MISRRALLACLPPVLLSAQNSNILSLPPPAADEEPHYGDNEFQLGELRVPKTKGPHPVLIVIHGGYWRAGYDRKHIGHLCAALTAKGLATWSLEYRRLGNPGGGWPGTFDDILKGADFVKDLAAKHKLDPKRVAVTGHSAGGHLALWLAAQRPNLLGAIALAPVADLKRGYELKLSRGVVGDLLGGSPDDVPDRYAKASPIELLPIRPPQRLIHGDIDDVVPIDISRRYIAAAKAKKSNATLTEIPSCGHFDLIDPRSKAWATVEQTVMRIFKK